MAMEGALINRNVHQVRKRRMDAVYRRRESEKTYEALAMGGASVEQRKVKRNRDRRGSCNGKGESAISIRREQNRWGSSVS